MKRLIILICTACWLTVCAQGSESLTYEMYYTVTPDTANHYLDVRLDYEGKEAGYLTSPSTSATSGLPMVQAATSPGVRTA